MSVAVKIVKPLTPTQKQTCLTIIQNVIGMIKTKHS
jgi:hypothetical protein